MFSCINNKLPEQDTEITILLTIAFKKKQPQYT